MPNMFGWKPAIRQTRTAALRLRYGCDDAVAKQPKQGFLAETPLSFSALVPWTPSRGPVAILAALRRACRTQFAKLTASMPKPRRRSPDPRNPRFIPGIYDYCDRWCERCEFSHRCAQFAMRSHDRPDDPRTRDIENRKFWEALGSSALSARAVQKPKRAAAKKPAAGTATIEAAAAHEKRLDRRARMLGQRETNAALTYSHMVDEWFNNELRLPLQHVRSLERRVEKGLTSVASAKGELVRLNDCVEVIRWYQAFIYVKLCRGFMSFVEEEDERGAGTGRAPAATRDSAGSAKVALIAIERSLAAWVTMREMFPEETDSMLEILLHLDRLRRCVKRKFPRAKSFKRPGFDDKA